MSRIEILHTRYDNDSIDVQVFVDGVEQAGLLDHSIAVVTVDQTERHDDAEGWATTHHEHMTDRTYTRAFRAAVDNAFGGTGTADDRED
jgi:hypothetical protein